MYAFSFYSMYGIYSMCSLGTQGHRLLLSFLFA